MKAKSFLFVAFFFIFAAFSNHVVAQENLNALIKKCETMDDVDISIVHQRDRKTMKTTQIIKSVSIKNKKSLVDDFIKAFELDRDKAYQAIDNKKKGRMLPSFYQFSDGSRSISYSFSVSGTNGENASISVIQKGD